MEKTDEILQMLKSIDNRLCKIEEKLDIIENNGHKITEHIDFVDSVYEAVKKPLFGVLSYYNTNNLQIKDKKLQ
jgi:hypothetical protein